MDASPDLQQQNAAPLLRKKRKRFSFFILFAGIAVFLAAAGALYFALRPETLRIAVGPSNSDDQKLVQALAATFARQRTAVRLAAIPTDGPTESLALLGDDRTDLAVARADLDMPADAQSVAILRKNFVVLWSPSGLPAKRSKKAPVPKIKTLEDLAGHRLGVIGTTKANVTLLRVILSESGIDPEKVAVVQFSIQKISEMARDTSIDAFMSVGPLDSKITSEAIAATAHERGEPKFLPIDVSDAIAQKHPAYQSEEIPGSTFNSSPARPDEKIETVELIISLWRDGSCRRLQWAHSRGNCSASGRHWPGSCPEPPISQRPIPTRTPPGRRIAAPQPISTGRNEPSSRNTATLSGAGCCCYQVLDPPAPGSAAT